MAAMPAITRSKSLDSLGRVARKCKEQKPVDIQELARQCAALRGRECSPFFLDPRMNAIPIHSYGHIHHPFNQAVVLFKWMAMVNTILLRSTVGLDVPLHQSVWLTCYRSKKVEDR